MASRLDVPAVTQDDLNAFHARVYGRPVGGDNLPIAKVENDEEENGLWYYADGVPRTLTDEQITMFRHSEIQALLRKQRQLQSNKDSEFTTVPRNKELEDGVWGVEQMDTSEEGEVGEADVDDEQEYERFLERERVDIEAAAIEQRKRAQDMQKQQGGKASTRRIVRELDAAAEEDPVLDYGDDAIPSAAPATKRGLDVSALGYPAGGKTFTEGKKIWWPVLRA